MPNAQCLIPLSLAYLLGSIPFGLILTRLGGLGDIRAIGSGNIGATNVLRTGNKKLAALTLLLDMAKGYAAVWYAIHFNPHDKITLLVPLMVVLGHVFPFWLTFKGGKGVATALGAITAFFLPMGLAIIGLWIVVFYFSRISSLAALISIWVGPILLSVYSYFMTPLADDKAGIILLLIVVIPIALLLTFTHRQNIKRLLAGTEPSFGKKSV